MTELRAPNTHQEPISPRRPLPGQGHPKALTTAERRPPLSDVRCVAPGNAGQIGPQGTSVEDGPALVPPTLPKDKRITYVTNILVYLTIFRQRAATTGQNNGCIVSSRPVRPFPVISSR